jgi:hypothetical protein
MLPFIAGADSQGCKSEASSSVQQDRIYSSYWLYYDHNTDKTMARAQFRFGSAIGTTLELQAPAQVSFEDQPMPFNQLLDWHEVVLAGKVARGDFAYLDAEGAAYTNAAPAIAEIEFSQTPATLPRNAAYTLTWSGAPLTDGEDLEVVIAVEPLRLQFVRIDQRGAGARSIVIGADVLSQLPAGPAVLTMRRHHDYPLEDEPGGGGKLTTTYQPLDRAITLQ